MMRIYKTDSSGVLNNLDHVEENTWIHLVHPTIEEIDLITTTTNINKKWIVKVLEESELSRIEYENENTLIIANIPTAIDNSKKNKYRTLPLGIIHTPKYIITILLKESKLFDDFENGNIRNFYTEKKTRFTIELFMRISQGFLYALNEMDKDIKKQEKVLAKSTKNQELLAILNIEKSLVYFIGALQNNQITLEKLAKGTVLPFFDEDESLLEDALVECNQAIQMANIYKEIMASTTETYASIISNNLNVIMKFLSGITIVFSIPTMIASFMGMNVPLGIFSSNPLSFLSLVLLSAALSFIIAYLLKKKNML